MSGPPDLYRPAPTSPSFEDDEHANASHRLLPQADNGPDTPTEDHHRVLLDDDIPGQARAIHPTNNEYESVPATTLSRTNSVNSLDEDPEVALHRTADQHYVHNQPKPSCFRRYLNWYKPVYDFKTEGLSEKERRTPRYGNGRFKLWQFILLHILVFILFLILIIGPLSYFVFVPAIIQSQLNTQQLSNLDLHKMEVHNMSPDNVAFYIKGQLPATTWIPITADIGSTDVQVHITGDTKTRYINMKLPDFPLTLNAPFKIDWAGYVSLDNTDVADTLKLVNRFSTEGLKDVAFQARGRFPITVWGIKFYSGLPLYFNLGKVDKVTSDIKSLMTQAPNFLKSQNMNSAIRQKFTSKDLISVLSEIGFPEMHIDTLDLEMNDRGVTVHTSLWLENPVRMSLGELRGMTFGLTVEGELTAKVTVRQLSLKESLQNINLSADIVLDDPSITPDRVSAMISKVLDKVLVTGKYEDLKVAITGPITIDNGDWVSQITDGLAIYLPMKELMDAMQVPLLRSLLTLEGVSALAGSTKINAAILSDRIVVPINLAAPRLLPLPPKLEIKYNITAGIFGGDQKTLGLNVSPITIVTTDDQMIVNTTVTIFPENSMAAADALALAINPLLAAVPKASSINVKQLSFAAPGQPTAFKWSDNLFKQATVAVPLPPMICIPCITDLVMKSNSTDTLFAINSLAVDQMTTAPGFQVAGSANVVYPPSLPQLSLDLGFASLELAVERVPAATLALPIGLKFAPSANPVALNAQAVLSRAPELPAKVQSLVDSILKDGAPPSNVGITNILFGPSANQTFVTFSKIAVELSTDGLKEMSGKMMDGMKSSLLKPGMIKFQSADLEVVSSTDVNVGFAADILNPSNISISLGHVDADITLDDGRLISLALPPIKISTGPNGVNLKLALGVATGANGMAEKVAALANEFLNKQPLSVLLGATNLVLSPPGTRGQAGGAVIDQIKPVKLTVPPAMLAELTSGDAADSPLDASALMPKGDLLQSLKLQNLHVETLPGATLAAAAAAVLDPMALTVKLPFAQVTMELENSDLVIVQIAEFALVKGAIGGKVLATFPQTDDSIPDKVAAVVQEFMGGSLSAQMAVKTIYFGGAGGDRNDLLSLVKLDLTSFTKDIKTGDIMQEVMKMMPMKLPARLQDLMAASEGMMSGVIDVQTLPQKTIGLNANVGVKLPFTLSANIGYMGAKVGINQHPLLGFLLPTGIKVAGTAGGGATVALNTAIPFEDDDNAQTAVATVVSNFFAGSALDTTIDLGALGLGYSAGDTITALSKVKLNIPLDSILAVDGPSDIFSLVAGTKPALGGIVLETRPGNSMGVVVDMTLSSPLKIAAKVGYVGAFVGLNSNPVVDFSLPQGLVLDATGPQTRVNLNTALNFIDNEATQTTVAQVVENFVMGRHLGAVIGVGKIALGASAGDIITALSKVQIPADLERGLNTMGVAVPFKLSGGSLGGLNAVVQRVMAHTAPAKTINLGAAAEFNLPFPVSLKLGYAALSAAVSNNPLADIVVPKGLAVAGGNNGRAALNVEASLAFTDTDATQTTVAELVNGFAFTGDLKGITAGVSRVFVGNSANEGDRLTILSKIDLDLDVATLLGAAGIKVPMDISQAAGALGDFGGVNVETAPGRRVLIGAGPTFKLPLPFPVDLAIGHIAAKSDLGKVPLGTDGYPLVDLTVPGGIAINTMPGTAQAIKLNAELTFTDTEATQDEVAMIISQALHTDRIDSAVGARAIQIGASPTDLITAFNKIAIRLDLTRLIQQMGLKLPIQFGQIAGNTKMSMTGLGVETLPAKTVAVNATVGFALPLPVSLSIKTGYFFTRATVGEAPLLRVALNQPLSITSGAGQNVLAIGTNLVFIDTEQTQDNVARLVYNALNTNRFDMSAGVDGIEFGSSNSPADVITILRKAQISLGLDDLTKGTIELPINVAKMGSVALRGGEIGVSARPNKELAVNATVLLGTAFPVQARIGYLSSTAGLSAAKSGDLNNLLTFEFPNPTGITLGGQTLSLGTTLRFIDTDATQNDVNEIFQDVFNKGDMPGRVGLKDIKFGVSGTDYLTVLNKVSAALGIKDVLGMAGVKVPLELGGMAQQMGIKLGGLGLEALPQQTVAASAVASFQFPFNLNVDIPHFATDAGLNGADLVAVGMPIRVSKNTVAINATAKFYTGEQIKQEVNNVVNLVLSGRPTTTPNVDLNIKKLSLGASATDVITAFQKVDAKLKLANILHGMGIKIPLDISGNGGLISFAGLAGDLGMAILPGKQIRVDGAAGIKFGFDVKMKAFVGADVGVNGAPLARAGVPIAIQPDATQTSVIALNTTIQITENDATPAAVGKLMNNYFGASAPKLDSSLDLSNLQFGAAANDVIDAFTAIKVSVPLDLFVGGTERIEIGKLLASLIQAGKITTLQIRRLLAQFAPDSVFNLGLGVTFPGVTLPVKLGASVPYLHVPEVKLDSVPFMDLGMTGFELTKTMDIALDAAAKIKDSRELTVILATYIGEFVKTKRFPGALRINGAVAGGSANDGDVIKALSMSEIPMLIDPVLQAIVSGVAIGDGSIEYTTRPDGVTVITIKHPLIGEAQIMLNKLDVAFNEDQSLSLSISLGLGLPFPLMLDIPYVHINGAFDKTPAMDGTITGLKTIGGANGVSTLDVTLRVAFSQDEAVAIKFGELVDAITNGGHMEGYLVASGIVFGYSAESNVKAIAGLPLPIPMDTVIKTVGRVLNGKLGGAAMIAGVGMKVGNFLVETKPGQKLDAGVTASFSNMFPITIRGLNHLGLSFAIDPALGSAAPDILQTTVQGLSNISPGANAVNVLASSYFPPSDAAQDIVKNFFGDVIANPAGMTQRLVVAKLTLGVSEANAIKIFSKARFSFAAKDLLAGTDILNAAGRLIGIDLSKGPAGLLSMIELSRAIVDLGKPGKIISDVDIGLRNLSISADVNMGYFASAIAINKERLTTAELMNGLKIKSGGGTTSLALALEMEINDSPTIAYMIGEIARAVSSGSPTGGTIGLDGLTFGVSKDDKITTFSKALMAIQADPLIGAAMELIKPLLAGMQQMQMPAGWGVDAIDLDAKSADTLSIDVVGHSPNNGQFSITLPYASMEIAVDNRDFVVPLLNDVVLKDGRLSAHAETKMVRDAGIIAKLGAVMGDLVFHRPFSASIASVTIKKILFGTKEKPFQLLSKLMASMQIGPLLQQVKASMDAAPIEITDIQSRLSTTGFFANVFIPLNTSLPLNMKFSKMQAGLTYRVANAGNLFNVADIDILDLTMAGGLLNFKLDIKVDTDAGKGVIQPLYEALPALLTWQSFSRNAFMGYAKLTGSGGGTFDVLDKLEFRCPDLTLWEPLEVHIPVPVSPLQSGGLAPLPFGTEVVFRNPWALHIDIGTVSIALRNGGKDLLRIATNGPAAVLNGKEGGAQKATRNLVFSILLPFDIKKIIADTIRNILNPLGAIIEFFEAIKNLFNPAAYQIAIVVQDASGQDLAWFSKVMDIVFTDRFRQNSLGPILGALLVKSSISIFGQVFKIPFFNFENLPFIKPLLETANGVLAQMPSQIRMVGPAPGLMAPGLDIWGLTPFDLPANFTLTPGNVTTTTASLTETATATATLALPSATITAPAPGATQPANTPAPSTEPAAPAPKPDTPVVPSSNLPAQPTPANTPAAAALQRRLLRRGRRQ
ncbi:hypothetical protein DFS34DRAFT_184515 [Phlyctochytrium arcticum]|nr:hypothetical protein DFS34DRAFT_184515 [Phlyctochytrium arcticum]